MGILEFVGGIILIGSIIFIAVGLAILLKKMIDGEYHDKKDDDDDTFGPTYQF